MPLEARNRSLPDWFTRFRLRQTVLPRFQRFEAWGHASVTQLFNTILQDLPLGAVLVLEVGNEEPFISRPISGAPEFGEKVTEHLLDGQQRMTALWRGLANNYEDRKYFLIMRSNRESGLPYVVDSVARSRKAGEVRARPLWADEPLEQWSRRMVPLELCAPDMASHRKFSEWARTAVVDTQERDVLSEQIAEVRQKFASFNVPFLSLPVNTRKEVALDVFIKMNTSGVELTIFDVLVAQLAYFIRRIGMAACWRAPSAGLTAVGSGTLGTRWRVDGMGSCGTCRAAYGPRVVIAPVITASMAACG